MIDKEKQELQQLNQAIPEKLANYTTSKDDSIPDYFDLQTIGDAINFNKDITLLFEPVEEGVPEEYDPEILDQYLSAQVPLPV